MSSYHTPVLLEESIALLDIKPDGTYADLTFGGGGHSRRILQSLGERGSLYGFDQDRDTKANAPDDERFHYVESNFRFLRSALRLRGVTQLDGILADLGVSSHHFDSLPRGFSFRGEAPLDMRMNQRGGETAADVVNNLGNYRTLLVNNYHRYPALPPVFTFMYREAVIDGYLVDHDAPHQLHTQLSDSGIHYKSGDKVITFDPITGEVNNAELLDDELDFEVEHFNRSVINENFNRAILEEIARDIDPEDASSGKTLIYAVDDKHADMIVQILKEIYSRYCVDENAIMKITGSIGDRKRIDQAIRRFKNEAFPSIAVTVDFPAVPTTAINFRDESAEASA